MASNQVPVGHIHTHSPQLPWINEKTKTWWIGNHDTKQPYRGLKGDSVKGDKGDRGNMWIHIDQSTEVAPEDSRDNDYLVSSASEPISVAGVSLSNGEYVQVLSVNPFHVSGVIGRLKGNDGEDGTGSTGPAGNSVEIRYAKNTDSVNAPDLNRADRTPPGWTTNTINPAEGEFVWETRAYVDGENNLVGLWSEQFRNTGIGEKGDTGEKGPTTMLRFDFDHEAQYFGSTERVELVKYNEQGYQTKTTAGVIPVGTLPTNSIYWEGPIAIDNHVWADVLIAYNAYIGDLVVGQISTGIAPAVVPDPNNDGERYTVGFQPSGIHDPTSTLSRHGMRLYFPSGRIMMYQGWVNTFPIGDDDFLENKGATIWFKDEENSPIDYYIDGGVIYIPEPFEVTNWYQVNTVRRFSVVSEIGIRNEITIDAPAQGGREVDPDYFCFTWSSAVLAGHVGFLANESLFVKETTSSSGVTKKFVTAYGGDIAVEDGFYYGIYGGDDLTLGTTPIVGNTEYCNAHLQLQTYNIVNGEVVAAHLIDLPNTIIPSTPGFQCTSSVPRVNLQP